SGQATVGGGGSLVAGYPDQSLLTYTQWLYERGFNDFQLGYASALAVLLFVVSGLVLVILLRKVKGFMPEEASL
ncbi:MAG TPA: sugar ABC transporter permease, partial [Galbitalea sp.]